jgi:hypothetical protein
VLLSFVGVGIGSLWMLSLAGLQTPYVSNLFRIHKTIQLDGFLTLLIMGVSYMIIPRFRNTLNPSKKLTVTSFLLVLASVVLESFAKLSGLEILEYPMAIRLAGILTFAGLSFYTMRVAPKLLKETDYFMAISILVLVILHVIPFASIHETNSLNKIQLWLLFPILTIFSVEYKMLPSFLGFIRPKRNLVTLCLAAATASSALGVASLFYESQLVSVLFGVAFVVSVVSFALSVYVYGGFDNREKVSLMPPEKRARYNTILVHTRIGFVFLVGGLLLGIAFYLQNNFLFYDLAIHYTAIGFIGITIMLFLPLMLPPITGKSINFMNFNKLPIILILSALTLRTLGDIIIDMSVQNQFSLVFGMSGLVVLAAMFCFVAMIHKSMEEPAVNAEFKKKKAS